MKAIGVRRHPGDEIALGTAKAAKAAKANVPALCAEILLGAAHFDPALADETPTLANAKKIRDAFA